MYHYIGNPPADDPHRGLFVPAEEFRAQLAMLNRLGRRTVSPEEFDALLSAPKVPPVAWLTFDDGKLDNFTEAFPALCEHRAKATFFVIVDRVLGGEAGYMDLAMMREVLAAGMSIGSHTLSHPHLARISAAQLREEVASSKKKLEDALGVEITSFCYPYGNFDDRVIEAVQAAGYRTALSTIRDNRNGAEDRFRLKRAMVQPGRTGLRFRYLFSPVYHFLHDRKNRRRWQRKERGATS